jgi:hypothetical protein
MTGQTLLDTMELLNQELQLQPGESDVSRGLLALNIAQDYFESLVATRVNVLGSQTGTVLTVNATETTTFPSGVLRIDRLQLLDSTTLLPSSDLVPVRRAGGHVGSSYWPLNILASPSPGAPGAYWANGTNIYWSPTPNGVYTIRWYGFKQATDITASGTFLYPDIVRLPICAFATRMLKMGVDDAAQDVSGLGQEAFKGIIETLSMFNRDGAVGLEYSEVHDT